MALAARAQQEALLQLVSFASLSASFTAPALWPPLEPGFFSILLFAYVFRRRFYTRKLHPFVAYFGALIIGCTLLVACTVFVRRLEFLFAALLQVELARSGLSSRFSFNSRLAVSRRGCVRPDFASPAKRKHTDHPF